METRKRALRTGNGPGMSRLTKLRLLVTPSRTKIPYEPIIFASIMSVSSRSPTTAISAGDVTCASGSLRKYSKIS